MNYVLVAVAALIFISAVAIFGGGNINTTPCRAGSVEALFSSCPRK